MKESVDMKKKSLIAILIVFLIISGCTNKQEVYYTVAEPFSDEQREALGMTEITNDYYLENLQSFERENGNKMIYMHSAPIEQTGNEIQENETSYLAEGTYFRKSFPKTLSSNNPIEIGNTDNYANCFLNKNSVVGKLSESKNAFGQYKQGVIYEDAFGKDIDYICYPTSFGVNTEIVIPKRTNEYKYQIKMQLPNLAPDTSSPDYILFKTALEKGQVKSLLYTPLLVDKNGNWSYANSVKLLDKDVKNNIYTVEYIVDEKFLNDKNTKYPVVLNQSIYLYKSKQPDTSAYENTGDVASHYLSPYILLGDETLKGEGWTYVRFETLNSLNIDPEKIVSAKYVFHNLFYLKKETKISAYAVKADWCSINTRWFNRPPFDEKPISEVIVKTSGDYELDLTALLVEMMKNKGKENATYSIQNSFMIRSDTENSDVIISSGDNGLFSPVLEIVLSE